MTKVCITVVVFVLAMPVQMAAHRLDEYLQAARVSLDRAQITLELDMTPGVNVAPAIVTLLDRNGDGTISQSEAGAYGNAVLKEIVVELDGHAVPLTLARVEIPSRDEMSDGLGTIQLRAVGARQHVTGGRRLLHFRNNHQPEASVYLVNALMPEDAGVSVVSQARDPRQQSVRVEYDVGPRWTAQVLWLVLAAVVLVPLLGSSDGQSIRHRRSEPAGHRH
jgi:hypothetical protein